MFVANRGSSATAGRPSTWSHSRRHSRSFCTASCTEPPPAVPNVPYGAIVAWLVPVRGGGVAVYIAEYIGWDIHSVSDSNNDTDSAAPSPVVARVYSAARIELNANMPPAMSATEMPALAGASALPVTDSSPVSHWISRS